MWGVVHAFDDRIVVATVGAARRACDGLQGFGVPSLIRPDPCDPSRARDLAIGEPHKAFIRMHQRAQEDALGPTEVELCTTPLWNMEKDCLTKVGKLFMCSLSM